MQDYGILVTQDIMEPGANYKAHTFNSTVLMNIFQKLQKTWEVRQEESNKELNQYPMGWGCLISKLLAVIQANYVC